MEDIKIHEFLKKTYGDGNGDGSGDGSGYGNGDGSGDGSGYGNGYGNGDGSGDGSGYGSGSGYGNGYGDGSGYGNGNGYGDGSGYGYGYGSGGGFDTIKSINGEKIHCIDGQPTILNSIHKDVARGAILQVDFTLKPCYIVKSRGYFAHGETIKKAMEDLNEKIFNDIDVEEKIDAFLGEFELDKKYPAHKFYEWHHKLTGSCEMGRKTFVEKHNIDLGKDEFTVEEFIELTQNDFGGEVIKELKERISDDKWR